MSFQLHHGVDIVDVARIRRIVERWGARFLQRIYTSIELRDAAVASDGQIQHERAYTSLAARWAAKEAFAKALGVGLRIPGSPAHPRAELIGLACLEIEVVRLPSGKPTLHLHGQAAQTATAQGVQRWELSLSHSDTYAIASVIGLTIP